MQNVFIEPKGQDDNLGDSVLRAALIDAVRGEGQRFHLHLEGQTSDYTTGFRLGPEDVVHSSRGQWLATSEASKRPVWLFNAGEWILQQPNTFPGRRRTEELNHVLKQGGSVIVSGLGVRDPFRAARVTIDPVLMRADVVSWRDEPTRHAVGFGKFAPDWAFWLGTPTSQWTPAPARPLLAVTLRFDRPWPADGWFTAVRELAARTSTQIVTVAQVGRDAPHAVRLAKALGAEYLAPPSMSHAPLDAYIREVYSRSLGVISDRAHGLIIGATEGAYPIGTAADPGKIRRMLDVAGLGTLTGEYPELSGLTAGLEEALPGLAPAIDTSRERLSDLADQIRAAIARVA
ncbi:hypothetical protein [Nesterenkonia ebinurensis]|uniref:hypothetical protein n=1 Tax=Nesterenkonia ebinurensis TaxID=2608252 RepID=UPI001CC6D692|nr:hypothetical protein [Nesterenkonia ebinurensis]